MSAFADNQDEAEYRLWHLADDAKWLAGHAELVGDPNAVGDVVTTLLALEIALRKRLHPKQEAA